MTLRNCKEEMKKRYMHATVGGTAPYRAKRLVALFRKIFNLEWMEVSNRGKLLVFHHFDRTPPWLSAQGRRSGFKTDTVAVPISPLLVSCHKVGRPQLLW
jgi:hypothetical protein